MRYIFIFLLFFSYLFAIKDYMIKKSYILKSRVLYSINDTNYPYALNNVQINNDEYNTFIYGQHFRIIYGNEYNNSLVTKNLAIFILNVAEEVWNKEVNYFGFRAPNGSDRYYIDIYIGNKNAYNPEEGYISISSNLAGYATTYFNGIPYFVINPSDSDNIIKVTIAHEFFHLIQYAYGLNNVENNNIWYKNIWFLEATATMMEDEVFDDVNDYIGYLRYYLPYTNLPLEYYNGGIEYGKVLFAKYIVNTYGMEKIKEIFENYETNETILDDLKREFNFNGLMLGYAKCLVNKESCFRDGSMFPSLVYDDINVSKKVYLYGIVFSKRGFNRYLNSSNQSYLQEDFQGNQNCIIDVNNNGLIFISEEDEIDFNITKFNEYIPIEIKRGWNFISNIFESYIDISQLPGIIVWVYRNGSYKAYSNIQDYRDVLIRKDLFVDDNQLRPDEGFWIYSDKDYNISFSLERLSENNINIDNDWNIVGFSSAFVPDFNDTIIWNYYNNKWYFYGNFDVNYSKLNIIIPQRAYFIKRQ